jgi:hypothetical protein
MVYARMGLLDDAIREHLELKRRRGADPGEVAREQREALDPVPRGEVAAPEGVADLEAAAEEIAPGEKIGGGETALDAATGSSEAGTTPVRAHPITDDLGEHEPVLVEDPEAPEVQETAELDMQKVFGQEPGAEARPGEARPGEARPGEEDSLEWEVPGEVGASGPGDTAGEEDHFPVDPESPDVLEETPEFLRETPEQDRLWFEQRPPRDFDFDE